MRRPICVIGLTLAPVTFIAFMFSARQALMLSIAAAATGVLFAALGKRSLRVAYVASLSAAAALAGVALFQTEKIVPFERAAGEVVEVRGLITEASRGNRAIFYTMSAEFPGRPDLPGTTFSLRMFGDMEYGVGDVIACTALLDSELPAFGDYSFSRGIFASGQVKEELRLMSGGYPVQRALVRLRESMRTRVYGNLSGESADLVSAMVLGFGDNVDADIYSVLNRSGTAHLLSISGLHLSAVTAVVLLFLEGMRIPRRASSLAATGAALVFSVLVGFSASIARSFTMTAIALLARAGPRKSDSLSSLGFAVTLICIFRPVWTLGRGFWFSACSTLGILLFAGKLEKLLIDRMKGEGKAYNIFVKTVVGAGAVSLSAYVFTLPLSVLFNGWVSVVSPLANIMITPFVLPLIVGGVLCTVIADVSFLTRIVGAVTNFCIKVILEISRIMAALPFATAPMDQVWMLFWLALVIGAAIVLFIYKPDRRLGIYTALLVALLFGVGNLTQIVSDRNTVQLSMIDDCDAVVLLREDSAVVLGTPSKSEISRLMRYLEYRGVSRIQAVIAADCGEQIGSGLLRLSERYPVDCIIGPNDIYILEQIAAAMPGIPVYSGGYASLEVLGGADVSLVLPEGDILLAAGNQTVLKSAGEFDVAEPRGEYDFEMYSEGAIVLNGVRGYEPSPIGRMLFGEKRFRLKL